MDEAVETAMKDFRKEIENAVEIMVRSVPVGAVPKVVEVLYHSAEMIKEIDLVISHIQEKRAFELNVTSLGEMTRQNHL